MKLFDNVDWHLVWLNVGSLGWGLFNVDWQYLMPKPDRTIEVLVGLFVGISLTAVNCLKAIEYYDRIRLARKQKKKPHA